MLGGESPFVGEVIVIIFLEGEKVVEVVVKVMMEMDEVAVVVSEMRLGWNFSWHIFLAAPSPLSLLLFKLVLVSTGVSSVCWFDDLVFFFVFFAVGDAGVITGAGVAGDTGTAADDGGAFFLFLRRRGGTCFPLFRGPLPLPGHLGPALLVTCFWLDLTRALSLRLLADGGGGCCGCCSCGAFDFLWAKLGYMPNFFARPAPGASSLHHHHLPVPAG